MKRITKLLCWGWALLLTAGAAEVDEALATARSDLERALTDLAGVREEIAGEKPGMSADFAEVELELRDKRRLARIARMGREDREQLLRELERDRMLRRQDVSYLGGLLKDHALKIETVSSPGEPRLGLDSGVLAGETADDPVAALEGRLGVVDASLDRLEQLIGGSTAPGRARGPDGGVSDGQFAAAGPLAWFAGPGLAGAAIESAAGGLPRVDPGDSEGVATLLAGGEAVLGLDVTGGKARALEEIDGGPLALFRKGGLWIWPIIGLALLSLVFGVVKLVRFSGYREPGEAWLQAVVAALRAGDRAKAEELAVQPSHPVAGVMKRLVEVSGSTADLVEETLYEQLMGVQQKAAALLPVIAVTAATAPLLGLLGTVSGMIRTFNLITLFGSGDPKPLAGGISEALITTLFGLVVAIPALILHAFLSRRSQGIVQTTERLGLGFVNSLRAS